MDREYLSRLYTPRRRHLRSLYRWSFSSSEELPPQEVLLGAMEEDGFALELIPPEQRTWLLCKTAVDQTPYAILHVPQPHRASLEAVALKADPDIVLALPSRVDP